MAITRGIYVSFGARPDKCSVIELAIEEYEWGLLATVISRCDKPPVAHWTLSPVCQFHHEQLDRRRGDAVP
jgi:hypothetical protein